MASSAVLTDVPPVFRGRTDTPRQTGLPSSSSSVTTESADVRSASTPATSLAASRSRSGSCRSVLSQLPALTLNDSADWDQTATDDVLESGPAISELPSKPQRRRASTTLLLTHDDDKIREILGEGENGASLVKKCCGGGCCRVGKAPLPLGSNAVFTPVQLPDNQAFRSLGLDDRLTGLSRDTVLTGIADLPDCIVSFERLSVDQSSRKIGPSVEVHPPEFVQPHPPYSVFSAPVQHARDLTKPGAQKRTIHFDIDVTDYPEEGTGIDFKVGGAIGVCPRNSADVVTDIFNCLGVPSFVRDQPILMKTGPTRWPTIWGEEEERQLVTSRRELLTWCVDVQSVAPTKQLLRLLAQHTADEDERKILLFLVSSEGQGTFCDMRTGPHLTVSQLLNAFPSSQPPVEDLLSVLPQLMPRFYSLSNDPYVSATRTDVADQRRLIEIAVTVHEDDDWRDGKRTGVGSGFMARLAQPFIDGEASGAADKPAVFLPMFRGLMANPLSREFATEGPMLLIGAGVGIAPFRGFILNRLRYANCANKVWLIQGIRDAALDQLYAGELGPEPVEKSIKHLVQSRRTNQTESEARYVQDEVRIQAGTVWSVITAVDGRVCVCGSSKGMGEGVEEALIDVACLKGKLNRDEAVDFWRNKKLGGQYITETW